METFVTVLKRHTTAKHKGKGLSKEKEGSDNIKNAVHPSQSFKKQPESFCINNLIIPPFKHPDPDQSKMQECEIKCDQCGFKCDSELVLKHHIAKKTHETSSDSAPI